MSNVTGAIKFKDGTIRFYEYYGTSDVCDRNHYATMNEVSDNWRKYKHNECVCGFLEPCSIYSDYGGGFYFNGEACKPCSFLTHDCDFDMIEKSDTDDWAKEIFKD